MPDPTLLSDPGPFPGSLLPSIRTLLFARAEQDGLSDTAPELRLAEGFFRRSDEVYLVRRNLPDVLSQWMDIASWIELRKPGEILVRCFEPESRHNGYGTQGTVLQTCMEDQPFIFDTLRQMLDEEGLTPHPVIHPVLGIERDDEGRLLSVDPLPRDQDGTESVMHWDLPPIRDPADREALAARVHERLRKAQVMVADFAAMRQRALWLAGHLGEYLPSDTSRADYAEVSRVQKFLHWLVSDHFVFMGYEEYALSEGGGTPGERLGLARLGADGLVEGGWGEAFPGALAGWLKSGELFHLGKGEDESEIHRPGKIDMIALRRSGEDGGELVVLFRGLFTHKAISEEVGQIPILREKLEAVLESQVALAGSHLQRRLEQSFRAVPVEFLFSERAETIERAIQLIMEADSSSEVSVYLMVGPANRSAFALVTLPRERFDDEVRQAVADSLKAAMGATYMDLRISFGQADNVVLQFYLTAAHAFTHDSEEAVQEALLAVLGTWYERLARILISRLGAAKGAEVAARYRGAFSEEYTHHVDPAEGAGDVLRLEEVRLSGELLVKPAMRPDDLAAGVTRLKIYQPSKIYLTDSTPVLNNFGLRVIDQEAVTVSVAGGTTLFVDAFRVVPADRRAEPVEHADLLVEGLRDTLTGRALNDSLNALVLSAGLSRREIDVLRLYIAYSRQLGEPMPGEQLRAIWCKHADGARRLLKFFRSRFHPSLDAADDPDRMRLVDRHRRAFLDYLENVEARTEDAALRRGFNLVEATLRTSFWGRADEAGHPLAVKIDAGRVEQMPAPRPFREIFVHHPGVEGVHLRGGPVARGGLRWSSRPADYRTEILGLMDTQMVKNVLIVPVGAKGGFVLRKSYASSAEARAAADEHYKIFIRGLLDLTDNVVDGRIVPPDSVVRYDGDDPYLVVAADKGTAHLSDTANAIAQEYGFWLDDAFASGGSAGYDHKLYAITAKGAWVCVRRHFRELGVDPEREVITAVGIGDMSGDVFGNGLLLSRTVKLLAVFNHLHIVLDPDPDPEASFRERKRLFDLPRSSWEDYDRAVLSKGGGIYSRFAKSIRLTPEVQAMLGVDEEHMTGDELIRAVLTLEADLLWNGGIGTYIKATTETHRDAADPVNDAVRVDAGDLRFRIVGEGGNLGFTQAARVEFAKAGGRLYTDAVDNSGGVDMSDHEVNLKILAQDLMASGVIDREQRDELLLRIAEQVSEDVQANNHDHSLGIAMDVERSVESLDDFRVLVNDLVAEGRVSRRRHVLPTDGSMLRRAQNNYGMVRPELCRVGPFVKMTVYEALLRCDWFDQPYTERWLMEYFPQEVRDRFGEQIRRHQLRKEIAATVVTNLLVNFMGMTHFSRLERLTGAPTPEIAMATLLAIDLLDGWTLIEALRDVDGVRVSVEYVKIRHVTEHFGQLAMWLLQRRVDVRRPEAVLERFRAGFEEYEEALLRVLSPSEKREFRRRMRYMRNRRIHRPENERAAGLEWVAAGGDAITLAEGREWLDVEASAALLTHIARATELATARGLATPGDARDGWESRAIAELRSNIARLVVALAEASVQRYPTAANGRKSRAARVRALCSHWDAEVAPRADTLARARGLAHRIDESGVRGLAPALVLYDTARALEDN